MFVILEENGAIVTFFTDLAIFDVFHTKKGKREYSYINNVFF